jgi:glycine C-acetyltransferase
LTDQLNDLRRSGSFFRLRELESACKPVSRVDGREVINLASNNYLGLADHPKLKEAAIDAVRRLGAGSGAVRTITGTLALHMELERKIAAFKHTEACVVFQSGFTANAGTVSSILSPEDHIISDELNHASIIDGCRLSRAKIHVFRHRDAVHAEERLAALDSVPGHKLLISDGVFSMDGDIGPLPALVEAAERHGDGGRRPFLGRAGPQRPRHGGSF